ncbi:MAG: hypothetical protein A3G34_13705 [Candidatus Lindowbacteria bacterium RIFCSPLOWO2_12_FULL_62_27]|nr:MAG: hypothetical protein A3I06_12590 [Candidatus Lindowbacteria bacterium RIFCSPLOWO2_02_FULL_62_12]OGH62634.1 MAG: hypothetical protein A3G34_13705 [Candidatus Lindowbacteria bacterium RIFCSPLOWO2_12_FULL_62_27]
MNRKAAVGLVLIPFLFSCATITVNVYFPDKDVEAAYENIESGLDFDVVPSRKDKQDTGTTKSKSRTEDGWMPGPVEAWAEPKINIDAELKKMADVQASLERRKDRIETLARLLDAKLVGLGRDGLIDRVPSEAAPDGPAETPSAVFGEDGGETALAKFISDENNDRTILIRGVAIATLRATKQDDKDKDVLAEAVDKSREQFVKARLSRLKPGWFYQEPDGTWRQVEPPEEKDTPAPSH